MCVGELIAIWLIGFGLFLIEIVLFILDLIRFSDLRFRFVK